ncbi:SHOCT domain-containing protein, partial [Cutibacterium acnes]
FQLAGKGEKRFEISNQPSTTSTSQAPQAVSSTERAGPVQAEDAEERLRKLKQLYDGGLINQQDYGRKKADILRSM